MLLVLLGGCAPVWGTWMFTREVTLATGDECLDSISHNFVGAYEPITAGDDPAWTDTDTGEYSPEIFFARVEQTGDGAVFITGTGEALPGTRQDSGDWLFYWTNLTNSSEDTAHTTGYTYSHTGESTDTFRVQGTFTGDTFEGTWEQESSDYDTWTESDTWSDEAAATVGTTGAIPASTYLLVIDGTGAEVSASNAQATYDCGKTGCTLTVSSSCAYRYTLTGVATGFAGDDSRWVEDAGQAAGD